MGDGTEKVVTFNLPLPLSIVGPLADAISGALEGAGWTDVQYVIDGGYVLAARPPREEG